MISQRFLPAVGMATFIVLFGSAAIAADNKVDTLEPACTCDCGGVYHRVKLSGTISCSDVSDSKKEC